MTLLNFYNCKTHAIVTEFKQNYSSVFGLKIGDTYKTNLVLVSVIQIPEKVKPLKIVKRRFKMFRFNLGRLMCRLGHYLLKKYE